MPNKKSHHNKPHRQHKDKHSSKSKSHNKKHKENVAQPSLSPIQELSKEKLKIDKNACGDFELPQKTLEKNEDTKEQTSEKKQIKEQEIDGMNDFFKKEYKKVMDKSIRHQSLEKNEPSLLDKSKALFRREKSFNDALHHDRNREEIAKKKKHKTSKEEQDLDKKKKHHHHHHHKSRRKSEEAKDDHEETKDPNKDKEKKHKHHHNKHHHRHKSKESRSPTLDPQLNPTRVQEVVFCQIPRNPFKLKNDKNVSDIKDLYQRSNKEKRKDQPNDDDMRRRQDKSNDPDKERPKKRQSAKSKDNLVKEVKEVYVTETKHIQPFEHNRKIQEKSPNRNSQNSPKPKENWPKGLSEITLGPYEQYFVFEKEMHSKTCKKHHKKKDPALRPSVEKRHELFQEEAKKIIEPEIPKVVEEEKIHQIVEGDIKNYFCKIQTMIDKKLDAILQVRKRPGSEAGDIKPEGRKRSRSKKAEKKESSEKTRSKSRPKESKEKRRSKSVTKEEIINEVLKRIKEEEQNKQNTFDRSNQKEDIVSKKIPEFVDVPLTPKPKSRSRASSGKAPHKQSPLTSQDVPNQNENFKHKKHTWPLKEDEDWAWRLRQAQKNLKPRDSLEYLIESNNPRKHRQEPKYATLQPENLSCRTFSEQFIGEHNYPAIGSASEETIRDANKYKFPQNNLLAQPFIKNLFKRESSAFLEEILLPPEAFRPETNILYRRNAPEDFIVQGIEPPIHDCIRPKTKKKPEKGRKLECKTVSIVAIQPHLHLPNQTQTSSKTGKSSVTDRDFVQKRMQSKRFKSYYKYSDARDDSSDAKSVFSDSCKMIISDPSDDAARKRKQVEREGCQVVPVGTSKKKWNRVSTPRESHLNNILEEPSNVCILNQNHEYFVPLKGTREFYHRALTSSHSDYCFRIDKKPAHSKISIQSGDLEDFKYIRHIKRPKDRSKNRPPIFPEYPEQFINPKSKSDVLLGNHQGKQVIRYIFLEDKQSRSAKSPFKRESRFKTLLDEKGFLPKTTREIQTVRTKDAKVSAKELKKVNSEQQQKQFKEIYKTIDDLEGNILSSLGVAPTKADAATSVVNISKSATRNRSIFSSSSRGDKNSAIRKPRMVNASTDASFVNFIEDKKLDEAKKKVDTLELVEDKEVKVVDACTGNSRPATPRMKREERSLSPISRPVVHSIAVGDDEDNLPAKRNIKPGIKCKIPKPQSKDQSRKCLSGKKSIGLSPIRVLGEEEAVQVSFNPTPLSARSVKGAQPPKKIPDQKKTCFTPEHSPSRIPTTKPIRGRVRETIVNQALTVKKQKPKEVLNSAPKPTNKVPHNIRALRSRNMVPTPRTIFSPRRAPQKPTPPPMQTQETQATLEPPAKRKVLPCIHVGDPLTAAATEHKPSTIQATGQNDPLNISVTAYNCQPTVQINLVQDDDSLTSSLSDSMPRHGRRSKSLVDLRTPALALTGSKSQIFCGPQVTTCNRATTNASSLLSSVNMEKFTNVPIFRSPRTYGTSTGAKMYGSSLFVTKDYKNQYMSAYERRKKYDQDIRKKKKMGSTKVDDKVSSGAPQTFEVRFLSMEGPLQADLDAPIINISLGNAAAIYHAQDKNCKEINLAAGEPDLLFDPRLTPRRHCNLVQDKEKTVTQLFPKENPLAFDQAEFCKEIVYLNLDNKCSKTVPEQNHKSHVGFCLDTFCDESMSTERSDFSSSVVNTSDNVNDVSNNISSDSAQSASVFKDLEILKTSSAALAQPLSCPTFPTGSPSFAYLYEDVTSENDDSLNPNVIGDLTKPFHQTFPFNANQYNVETPFYQKNDLDSSLSESVESGYGSVKSKNCKAHSLSNFFKRPNIAALLKAPTLTLKGSDLSCNADKQISEEMTTYAKKVQESCEKTLEKDEYQEISLQVLLGKSASVMLESQTLSLQSIESNRPITPVAETKEVIDDNSQLAADKDEELETVEESFSQNGCKLVLSNHSLKLKSTTHLGPEFFPKTTESTGSFKVSHKRTEASLRDSGSSLTLDVDPTNPFINKSDKDISTQSFFSLLTRIFEKELDICNKLYKDKEFGESLLKAIQERKNEKLKGAKCFGFFKRMRSGKASVGDKSEREDEVKLEQKASVRLRTLASNTRKCFTMLADAVKVNKKMDNNNMMISGLLKLLERIESGEFEVVQNDAHLNLEQEIRSEILESYKAVYDICEKEAKKHKRKLSDNDLELLRSLVVRHRVALLAHTDIIISYISQGLIYTESQLKAAVTFLTRSIPSNFNIKDFEAYCLTE